MILSKYTFQEILDKRGSVGILIKVPSPKYIEDLKSYFSLQYSVKEVIEARQNRAENIPVIYISYEHEENGRIHIEYHYNEKDVDDMNGPSFRLFNFDEIFTNYENHYLDILDNNIKKLIKNLKK